MQWRSILNFTYRDALLLKNKTLGGSLHFVASRLSRTLLCLFACWEHAQRFFSFFFSYPLALFRYQNWQFTLFSSCYCYLTIIFTCIISVSVGQRDDDINCDVYSWTNPFLMLGLGRVKMTTISITLVNAFYTLERQLYVSEYNSSNEIYNKITVPD